MSDKMKLNSIEQEAADCRAAFAAANSAVGDLVFHCHHEIVCEPLSEPPEMRIRYILVDKPKNEQALRLRLFRPFPKDRIVPELGKACAEWNKACAELDKAHAELDKARAELGKACAEWHKAHAELDKARAELGKACAEWHKARAELGKACAEWYKAHAEWNKARAELGTREHAKVCQPGCPWNGRTIMPLDLSTEIIKRKDNE